MAEQADLPNGFISTLKLLLIATVVICHSVPSGAAMTEQLTGSFLCITLGSGAFMLGVPGFFLISGYLYFRNISHLTPEIYGQKLLRRVKTLLVPYLLWNLVCCALFFLQVRFLNGDNLGLDNLGDWLRGFIYIPQDSYRPYAYAFWFIRNLIVIAILSPAVRLIARSRWAVAAMVALTIAIGNELYGFEFFTLGAAAAMAKLNPERLKINGAAAIAALLGGIAMLFVLQFISSDQLYVGLRYIAFAMLFTAAANLALRLRAPALLTGSTFFIYAFHQCFVSITNKFWTAVVGDSTSAAIIACMILNFATLWGVSWLVWRLMERVAPRVLSVLTGGR